MIRIDGTLWYAHHLAWLVHTGRWPDGLVVHINRNRDDNRPENLSIATKEAAHAHTKAKQISAQNVHEIFTYDAGKLRWRGRLTGRHRVPDEEAGGLNQCGYVVVEVGGKAVGAHRIVWLMHTGSWPTCEIDHINGVRHDNRIENLRDVDRTFNAENRRKASIKSKVGLLGVSTLPSGRFRARIRSKGVLHELGIFDSAELAHSAYVDAKRKLHAGNTL